MGSVTYNMWHISLGLPPNWPIVIGNFTRKVANSFRGGGAMGYIDLWEST